MVNEMSSFQPSISCSWAPNISSEILTFGDIDDPDQWDPDKAIVHTIAEDNFLCLKQPKEDVPCRITIKTNDPFVQITNISLVSEAHIFEIYGKHEEYIKTCRSDFFAQERGIDIYVGQPSLLTTHEISFKFDFPVALLPHPKERIFVPSVSNFVQTVRGLTLVEEIRECGLSSRQSTKECHASWQIRNQCKKLNRLAEVISPLVKNLVSTSRNAVTNVIVKFPGLRKEFWLCGIKLIIQKILSPTSTFDYHLIDEKLKSSNIPITEKAEKFKKFLQDYAANKYAPKNMDPQMLLKFMEGECMAHLKPVSSTSKSVSKYLSSLIPSALKTQNSNEQPNEKTHSDVCSSIEESTSSTLKTYVDESLQKLEDKLQQNFKKQLEEMEAKQNEKLDTILELLRNSALR